jgi:hypothetical protein
MKGFVASAFPVHECPPEEVARIFEEVSGSHGNKLPRLDGSLRGPSNGWKIRKYPRPEQQPAA